MKKQLLLAFCSAVLCLAQSVWAQKVWDGKIDSEWYWENTEQTEYTISTATQLAGLVQLVNGGNGFSGKTIKLAANIMLNDTANWLNWGKSKPLNAWTPIGNNSRPFSGTFDGNGNVIAGVYINSSGDYQGLFGYADSNATLKNFGVVASYVYVKGGFSEGGDYVGSLVGFNKGIITNCYAIGNINGKTAGGLAGSNSGTITDCYANGNVIGPYGSVGTYSTVGGLAGSNIGGTITNSYATGNIKGVTAGGLVGENGTNKMPKGTITNSYATGNVDGGTAGGLVGRNIGGTINGSYATGSIGNVNSRDVVSGGLVGSNAGGTVTDCYATGNVKSYYGTAGGLVGDNGSYDPFGNTPKGTITNSYAIGNVNGKYSIGGLVGRNSGTITNCYAMGYVKGEHNSGGLVGNNSGKITDCYATGNVKGSETAGGLVGQNGEYREGGEGTIEKSYAMGNLTGSTSGGLVGVNESGTVANCYAMGNLAGKTTGGLVGQNGGYHNKGTIEKSYATGIVNGTSSDNGGLVGVNKSGTIANSYYDRQTSGQSDVVNKGEPKSTVQMKQQAIFQGWDFDKIWRIDESKNNSYPYLQSSEKSLPAKYKYANNVQQGNLLIDKRDGKKYKTVVINTQTWMAENLNYDAKGSKCYDNKPANCTKYGRLYDWQTAIKACPVGWHLPTHKEWNELYNYADMYASGTGTYLRTTSGWDKGRDYDHNGSDFFGFTALPGGYYSGNQFKASGDRDQFFLRFGNYGGYWWSSSPSEIDSNKAYHWIIGYGDRDSYNNQGLRENSGLDNANKSDLFSVRCLQD